MPRRKSALQKLDSLSSLKDGLETMDHLEFPTTSSCYIYRVPPTIRKMNEVAYTPIMVSIGPYHHGKQRLKSMEEVKLRFLYKFLKGTQEKSLDDYVHVLRNQEGRIQRSYSEIISMESDKFVRMILTDAFFIIQCFLLRVPQDHQEFKVWSRREISRDLILLENQLPFFVLKDLFDLAFPNGYNNELPFEFVTFSYFCNAFLHTIVPNGTRRTEFTFQHFVQHHLPRLPDGTPQVHHLCDMLRIFYVRLDQQVPMEYNGREMKPVYSASKLSDAGIKFEVNEDEMTLLKLQYSKGVLKIPIIIVCDGIETQLRNVVAFEQCRLFSRRNMTDYILLLEYLIRTGKDVEILAEKGIIVDYIIRGNYEVASIIRRLARCTEYTQSFNNDYISLFEELNKFCDSPYHKYKEIFKQQYWSTPWRIASFLGAILLLLLTLIQTISSVIALFQK